MAVWGSGNPHRRWKMPIKCKISAIQNFAASFEELKKHSMAGHSCHTQHERNGWSHTHRRSDTELTETSINGWADGDRIGCEGIFLVLCSIFYCVYLEIITFIFCCREKCCLCCPFKTFSIYIQLEGLGIDYPNIKFNSNQNPKSHILNNAARLASSVQSVLASRRNPWTCVSIAPWREHANICAYHQQYQQQCAATTADNSGIKWISLCCGMYFV